MNNLPISLSIYDLRKQENIKELVEEYELKYKEEANEKGISKVQYFAKEFEFILYERGLRGLIGYDSNHDLVRDYIIEASKQFKIYLSKYFDGIDVQHTHRMNSYPSLASNDKLKYIGETTDLYIKGNIYRINEVHNWIHNPHELGYYITNEEYNSDDRFDSDFCVFYPINEIQDFEIVKE